MLVRELALDRLDRPGQPPALADADDFLVAATPRSASASTIDADPDRIEPDAMQRGPCPRCARRYRRPPRCPRRGVCDDRQIARLGEIAQPRRLALRSVSTPLYAHACVHKSHSPRLPVPAEDGEPQKVVQAAAVDPDADHVGALEDGVQGQRLRSPCACQ